MLDHYFAVIMAGGGGTRLWPFSRRLHPKQMIRLGSEKTLFQQAVDRLSGLFPPERILIVTVADQADVLRGQCPELPEENFLLEPEPRSTAAVVGYAALAIKHRDAQATMAVLTADHVIPNVQRFRELLADAYELAQQNYLVTLGIQPTHPATSYGYIQQGDQVGQFGGVPGYRVLRFREKPDEATAQQFLAGGDHVWNSGMFIWRVDRIWEEMQLLMPALADQLTKIDRVWDAPEFRGLLKAYWDPIQPVSIDYGIMEKSQKVAVLPAADLGWNDVGSWDALYDMFPKDANGNIVLEARHIGVDSRNTLVCADRSGRLIVTIGTEDLIVVETLDALLICKRSEAQKVRELVNLLKKSGQNNSYL
jgi:mannose-1-phosphate guanylyltransferase